MIRRSLCVRSVGLSACLMAMLYSTSSIAQQPTEPPTPPAGPPPSAYPQQPPPGYYPQQPPPGYYPQQPPPGYYPQQPPPGYYPPPMMAEPSEPPFRRGLLFMPYLGVQIPVGDAGDDYDPGLRLGTLLGGHINPNLSLNGELTIDVMNLKDVPSGVDITEVMVDMLFAPLWHFGSETFEGFIGPKLGVFGMAASMSADGESASGTARGFAYGMNLGFGVPVGKVAIGGLFSYVGRHATQVCVKESGHSEVCDDSPGGDDLHTLAITGLVLF